MNWIAPRNGGYQPGDAWQRSRRAPSLRRTWTVPERGYLRMQIGLLLAWVGFLAVLVVLGVFAI